jgi:predicted ATP-dependent serine protease
MAKTRYKCSACRFEFFRESSKSIGRCPYCNRQDTVAEMKGDFASRMLDEVDKIDERT